MGLLDRFLKDTARKVLDDVFEGGNKPSVNDAFSPASESVPAETSFSSGIQDERSCREKLLSVIGSDHPSYTVKEQMPATDIGGDPGAMPYSIAVMKGGEPVLLIMIIGKSTCSTRRYKWARECAEAKGIAFINFIEHYPNETDYIKNRLAKYI